MSNIKFRGISNDPDSDTFGEYVYGKIKAHENGCFSIIRNNSALCTLVDPKSIILARKETTK